MTENSFAAKCLIITILTTMFYGVCRSDQPSYQVSIFIHLHPKGSPIHLCNGAIVQSKLILTTAACVHYLLIPDKPAIPVHPSLLSITAGSTNAFSDQVIVKVAEIIFPKDFNAATMENELALLRLSEPLPLGSRDDIKWIILDEFNSNDKPCLAGFNLGNLMEKIPDYTQTEHLEILENKECLKLSNNTHIRKKDICSNYILPPNIDCNDLKNFIRFNGDRGTGLICNSHLVGLLSAVFALENNSDKCSEKPVKAFYTNVGSYIEWVYEIISQEEYAAMSEETYSASAPFDQKTEAIIISYMPELSKDEPKGVPSPVLKPEVQPLKTDNAERLLVSLVLVIFLVLSVHIF